jgi:hypothetical protein
MKSYEPMTRATSQAEFQQRKARAKQGKKEQGTGIVKSYEPMKSYEPTRAMSQ